MEKDLIFSEPIEKVEDFCFDERVAQVFDDMISRSVPLYHEAQELTAALVTAAVNKNELVYDLGCASGESLLRLAASGARLVGVDNSAAMLSKCRERLRAAGLESKVELLQSDIASIEYPKTSAVVLNYTLQFLPTEKRGHLLEKIRQSLKPDGVLILSEKILPSLRELRGPLKSLHEKHKRNCGYSELEIAQKRESLENVLIPLTAEENLQLLSGFSRVEIVLRWLNFVSIVAYK